MRLPPVILGFIALGLTLIACRQDDAVYLQAPENKYILCRGSALYLDNGKRWKSNIETTEGIDSMIVQLNKFPDDADSAAYQALGSELVEDLIYIVNHCEQMGNNHEMVHAYLNPLQELIVPLQVSGTETCKAQLPKIKDHLSKYHEYFE